MIYHITIILFTLHKLYTISNYTPTCASLPSHVVRLQLRRLFFDRLQLPESASEDVTKILDEVPGGWNAVAVDAPTVSRFRGDQEVMGLKRLEWLVWRPSTNSK